ncbi:hypothetical protein [Oryza sativa Japonica Group]|uniref:Uncharacterized protein n=1 Tax=Oryza sativa subsp. japonica TaxID=39947 RepID=Q5NBE0_ORYSJ|nr:hypothetical protein [Oryza sativa Japonica Group]
MPRGSANNDGNRIELGEGAPVDTTGAATVGADSPAASSSLGTSQGEQDERQRELGEGIE